MIQVLCGHSFWKRKKQQQQILAHVETRPKHWKESAEVGMLGLSGITNNLALFSYNLWVVAWVYIFKYIVGKGHFSFLLF